MKQKKIDQLLKELDNTGLTRADRGGKRELIYYRLIEDKQVYVQVLTGYNAKNGEEIEGLQYRVAAELVDLENDNIKFVMSPQVISTSGTVKNIMDKTLSLVEHAVGLVDTCEDVQEFIQSKMEKQAVLFENAKIAEKREVGQLVKHRDHPLSFGIITELGEPKMKVKWTKNSPVENQNIMSYLKESRLILPYAEM